MMKSFISLCALIFKNDFLDEISCTNDCSLKKDGLNKYIMLNEPISPYFTNIYNTLVSVICGVSLGIIFSIVYSYVINLNKFPDISIDMIKSIWQLAIIVLIICIVWHHYIMHNNFVAWKINLRDTFIPFSFSILFFVISASTTKNIRYFIYCFTLFCFIGFLAYLNSFYELTRFDKIKEIYSNHYNDLGENAGCCILNIILIFERKAVVFFLSFTVFFSAISYSVSELCKNNINYNTYSFACLFFITVTLIMMLKLNLYKQFNELKCQSK